MSTSIWPADYLAVPHDIHREHGNQLIVFLLSPFEPRNRYDELLVFCQSVCTEVGELMEAEVKCIRADSLSTPNVIHQDIWNYIQMADAIIADTSEKNGNVMMEIGVAASFRAKEHIIIIQDQEPESKFLFDISPARHLTYQRSLLGDQLFRNKLKKALLFTLAPAPYIPQSSTVIDLPVLLDPINAKNSIHLIGPSNSHRRILSDGLEFGSFYAFQYSWLTLGMRQFGNIKAKAKLRFSQIKQANKARDVWMGISIRSQHFFSDWSHLIYVSGEGVVRHTQPIDEFHKLQTDPYLGNINNFKIEDPVTFDLVFDEDYFKGSVGNIPFEIRTSQMPFKYTAGFFRFQTYMARCCIENVSIEAAT